jgi:hypothetical protein
VGAGNILAFYHRGKGCHGFSLTSRKKRHTHSVLPILVVLCHPSFLNALKNQAYRLKYHPVVGRPAEKKKKNGFSESRQVNVVEKCWFQMQTPPKKEVFFGGNGYGFLGFVFMNF